MGKVDTFKLYKMNCKGALTGNAHRLRFPFQQIRMGKACMANPKSAEYDLIPADRPAETRPYTKYRMYRLQFIISKISVPINLGTRYYKFKYTRFRLSIRKFHRGNGQVKSCFNSFFPVAQHLVTKQRTANPVCTVHSKHFG